MNFKKIKIAAISFGVLILLLGVYFIFQMANSSSGNMMFFVIILVLMGIIMAGVLYYVVSNKVSATPTVISESSYTIAESMRKVFKVVSAEGHFNEIYNYEETTKLFKFIPSKKKALVIVQAKILVGYDFEKFQWEVDDENRKVKLVHFPPPEILSTETDYKYYNIEEQFYNLFSREDLENIQKNSKNLVIEAAKKSHLPEVAAEQMKMLLTELLSTKNYVLENPFAITENNKQLGFTKSSFRE